MNPWAWLKDLYHYLNATTEGLHHITHFFIAGWLVYLSNLGVLILFAICREGYDLYKEWKFQQWMNDFRDYDPGFNWRDHFFDLCSWMLGGVVWLYLIVPFVGLYR